MAFTFFFLVMLLASLFVPNFLTLKNATNLLRLSSVLGVVAIGQAIVIVSGEFDLSVGATMTYVAVISADLMNGANENIALAQLAGFSLAILIGLINGLLVTRVRIVYLIVTLAMIGLHGAIIRFYQWPLSLEPES